MMSYKIGLIEMNWLISFLLIQLLKKETETPATCQPHSSQKVCKRSQTLDVHVIIQPSSYNFYLWYNVNYQPQPITSSISK